MRYGSLLGWGLGVRKTERLKGKVAYLRIVRLPDAHTQEAIGFLFFFVALFLFSLYTISTCTIKIILLFHLTQFLLVL